MSKRYVGELATWTLCGITPFQERYTARSGIITSCADDGGGETLTRR